jgi:hypothetical protein
MQSLTINKKVILVGNNSSAFASSIAHAQTLENQPSIIIVGEEKERGITITAELPQLVQNIIESAESFNLTQYEELTTPLSGREKRRQRRKQERKNK